MLLLGVGRGPGGLLQSSMAWEPCSNLAVLQLAWAITPYSALVLGALQRKGESIMSLPGRGVLRPLHLPNVDLIC